MGHKHKWTVTERGQGHFICKMCGAMGYRHLMPNSKGQPQSLIRARKCYFCKNDARFVIGTTHKQMRCADHKNFTKQHVEKTEVENSKILTHDKLMIDAIRAMMGLKNLYESNCKDNELHWLPMFMTDGNRLVKKKGANDNIPIR